MAIKCIHCKKADIVKEHCKDDYWDHTDEEQDWLHSDTDFDVVSNQLNGFGKP